MAVNNTLLDLIKEVASKDGSCLDVGCGDGALAFEIYRWFERVEGIDTSWPALKKAQEKARLERIANLGFYLRDADKIDYAEFAPLDVVVSHYFMSEALVRKAATALEPEGHIVFACIGEGNLEELGVESRFAFAEDKMARLLDRRFEIHHLATEERLITLGSERDAIQVFEDMKGKWKASGRWRNLLEYVRDGGRTFTYRTLVGRAQKVK